jgi:DNA modification methylase
MTPYYQDDAVTLWHGDSLAVLSSLPDDSVDCCVTSPPYFGLRDYGEEGQYGLEASPAEYVETMRAVFAQVRRVLADDGTLWLNIGDSYYSGRGNPGPNSADKKQAARRGWVRPQDRCGVEWSSPKNLLGIPWRTAFALQDDGWILRNDNIWFKTNAMPESVTDRLANKHEHVFMFSKSRTYWFDLDVVREAAEPRNRPSDERGSHEASNSGTGLTLHNGHRRPHEAGKNPGDVWALPTQPFAAAHFAVMAPKVAERCILPGCKPGGTVLDPFSGAGTTGMVAAQHGRKYVGIDNSRGHLDLSLRTRLGQTALLEGDPA